MEEKKYISICKALSDANRMKIFNLLLKNDLCAFEILKHLDCSQPTLSYHMRLLVDSGIVEAHKQGLWMHYNIDKDVLRVFSRYFDKEQTLERE